MKPPCLGCQSDAQPVACGKATMNAFMSAVVLFALDPRQIGLYIGGFCEEHAAIASRVVAVMAEKNKLGIADLVAKLDAAYLAPMKKK